MAYHFFFSEYDLTILKKKKVNSYLLEGSYDMKDAGVQGALK